MKHLLHRRDTEALVEGEPLDDSSGLEDVEAFLTSMRSEFAATPAPAPRPTLAATLDGRRELRPKSGPAPKPTFPKPRPRTHWGLRPIAAVFATGAVLFGGLASAGALPGPVQRTTASLGSHVGIHLPGRTVSTPSTDDGQPRTGPSVSTSPSSKVEKPHRSTPSTAPTVPPVPTVPTAPSSGVAPTPAVPTIPVAPTPTLLNPPTLSQLLHDLTHPKLPLPLFPPQPTP